jgi:hypothetical protein
MKRESDFNKWYYRSRTPKHPDGRKTKYWGYEDFIEFERVQMLKNAFRAGKRAKGKGK